MSVEAAVRLYTPPGGVWSATISRHEEDGMSEAEAEVRTVGGIALGVVAAIAVVLSAGALIVASGAANGSTPSPATDGAAAPAAATSVAVELTEFAIAPASIEVAAGGELMVDNAGATEHDLAVRDAGLGTPMIGAGASESLVLSELGPGTYEVYCTVPGHDSAGMVASLSIVGDGEAIVTASDDGTHGAGDAEPDWAALDAAMTESILAFPAETEGSATSRSSPRRSSPTARRSSGSSPRSSTGRSSPARSSRAGATTDRSPAR
jgi:manganese oxidase